MGDASRAAPGDGRAASSSAPSDASAPSDGPLVELVGSLAAAGDVAPVLERRCGWCRRPLEQTARRWCGKRCRQAAWRARGIDVAEGDDDVSLRLAYADPPYPGLAKRYYGSEPTYAGEVDHRRLLERLATFDGWALSTSSKALRDLLPLCPQDVIVCAWGKQGGVSSRTRGLHSRWEPIIVKPARHRRPGFPDWFAAHHARGGGTLIGRKPRRFVEFVLRALGASPVDTLDDLFPGTGIVGNVFRQFQARASSTPASTTSRDRRPT